MNSCEGNKIQDYSELCTMREHVDVSTRNGSKLICDNDNCSDINCVFEIRVITKLPNSEQSYKGKVKTHNYINRQNQSTTGKLWKP